MYLMSESSLPLLDALRLRSFPGGARRVLGWLLGRRKKEPAPDLALISLAASARKHAALFERAERLREKADRLENAGIPSESAANRAERARREVQAGLLALRASFASSVGGSAGERAFDHVIERLYPTLGVQGQ
jgi:ferric-dicitrate binding protein FerR (iron transport regulator)